MTGNNLDNLARWQATMDMAVYKFEKRTGLKLAGLPPVEISKRIEEWTRANKLPDRPSYKVDKTSGDVDNDAYLVLDSHSWRKKGPTVSRALPRQTQQYPD